MKPKFHLAALILSTFLTHSTLAEEGKWNELLDSKLSQWEVWMGVPRTSVKGLPEGTPQSDDYNTGVPLGRWDPMQPFAPAKGAERFANYENPHGQWNTAEFYVLGQQEIHLVNGRVVLSIDKARLKNGTPVVKGKLQIQSEGAEAYYRYIRIRPITAFPPKLMADAKLTSAR